MVVTEGNYLLAQASPWDRVRELCDEVCFVDPGEQVRLERLIARHVRYGRTPDQARRRATEGTDADNAQLVAASRERADVIVQA